MNRRTHGLTLVRVLIPVLILVAGVLGVGLLVMSRPRVEARAPEVVAPLVRVMVAEPRPVQIHVRTHGTVVPRTESELVPQVAGEVIWISPNLVSGGFFDEGETLVRIDPSDGIVDRQSARATVARAKSEFERASTELERQRRLMERGVTAQARIDDAENSYRVAEAALREARARLTQVERDLVRTELQAPFPGRVRSKAVDVGQFVNRGAPIATLYAVDQAEVRLPLPDRELRWLDLPLGYGGQELADVGPSVTLRAEFAGRPRSWEGRIVRTEGEIDPKSRMVHVVARVEDPYGRERSEEGYVPLAVGLFVEAEIVGQIVEGAFVLPRSALHATSEEGNRVYVIDDQDRLRVRSVELLRTEREEVVIGAGLEPGDRVTISSLPAVVDGMLVRIAEAPDAGDLPDPADAAEAGDAGGRPS
jgi:RND family efflux transporter MFP subunit